VVIELPPKVLDDSVDLYFGPNAPAGFENNWVQTIPGRVWFVIFRLYGPLEPWFNKTWRPGEIEAVVGLPVAAPCNEDFPRIARLSMSVKIALSATPILSTASASK